MQDVKEAANGAATAASEALDQAKTAGMDAVQKGYKGAREYASKGLDYADGVTDELAAFARRQPWLALAAAFALGYVAAKTLRTLSV